MPEDSGESFENRGSIQSIQWDRLKDEDHLMQSFESEASLVHSVGCFIREALSQSDAGIVVAKAKHLAGIERFLRGRELDVEMLQRSGEYTPLDAQELLGEISRDGRVNERRFFERVGRLISNASNSWGRVRVYGEMVSVLWEEGRLEEALELEGFWNNLARIHPFVLFCGYPKGAHETEGECFAHVCEAHSTVIL